MSSPKLSLALALGALFLFIEAPMRCSGNPVKVGELHQCDHDVKGTVYAIHEKQIMITGFDYDGQGPGTWFMGLYKGQTGTYAPYLILIVSNWRQYFVH